MWTHDKVNMRTVFWKEASPGSSYLYSAPLTSNNTWLILHGPHSPGAGLANHSSLPKPSPRVPVLLGPGSEFRKHSSGNEGWFFYEFIWSKLTTYAGGAQCQVLWDLRLDCKWSVGWEMSGLHPQSIAFMYSRTPCSRVHSWYLLPSSPNCIATVL